MTDNTESPLETPEDGRAFVLRIVNAYTTYVHIRLIDDMVRARDEAIAAPLRKRIEELEAALEPFARAHNKTLRYLDPHPEACVTESDWYNAAEVWFPNVD